MATRTFGAQRAAGSRIEEKSGQQSIQPGALGFVGYASILEKGNPGELIVCLSKADFFKKCGSIYPGTLGPDACEDFFTTANGAGGMLLVRVTDGNERVASLTLYQRNTTALAPMGRLDAINGGRWGGKEQRAFGTATLLADIDEATLQLPVALATDYETDELAGGYIELDAVANTRYLITGNTAAGLISVVSDSEMASDLAASAAPSNYKFYLVLDNDEKALSVKISDGEENKDTEFSLQLLCDGDVVKTWGNLHTDPEEARYWVDVINDDGDNEYILATDLVTGGHSAATRPANMYLDVLTAVANVLTLTIHDFLVTVSPTVANPTAAMGTTTDAHLAQVLTILMTSPTAYTVTSDRFGVVGTGTLGVVFAPTCKWVPPFTVTNGATILASADEMTLTYKPFEASALVNGYVYPNKADYKSEYYRIVSNTHKTVTVQAGTDLSTRTSVGKDAMVSVAVEFVNGRDGNADVVDNSYLQQAWDLETSPFIQVAGLNLGLIKFATPGVTATAVQQGGVAYAEAKNHQYRNEIPANVTTEIGALEYVNDTLGRSDYAKVSFPSFGDVSHPDPASAREGRRKTISLTGMIHGREAAITRDYQGYHKAQAGIDAKLPRLLRLPTLSRVLNEELLNPAGINVIKKRKGNFILWGDRTLHTNSEWSFAHKRELMSYYEQVLMENFDFIMFTINDAASDSDALTALIEFFRGEHTPKRALRGDQFITGTNPAARFKLDSELNTDSTRAAGDKVAEISLRLADTTERFIMRIGQMGVFEAVG
jgi:hypothetical protein